MNLFGFNTIDAITGLILFMYFGVIIGAIIGFMRFVLFSFMERRVRWSNLGQEVDKIKV